MIELDETKKNIIELKERLNSIGDSL